MISTTELERRWSLTRQRLDDLDADALVTMSSDSVFTGGCVRWLTDLPFVYRRVVIFHRKRLMTVVEHGSDGERSEFDGKTANYRGVGEVRRTAEFPTVQYTHPDFVQAVVDDLAGRGYGRVCLIGRTRMTHGMVQALEAGLPGVELVEDEDHFDRLLAQKSEEEIALLGRNVEIQTATFKKLLNELRPGMNDVDAMNIIRSEAFSRGGTGGVCRIGSASAGQQAMFISKDPMRKLEKGDQLVVLNETSGPGGYFTEMGRTIVLGRAPNELHDAAAVASEAMELVRKRMVPGASLGEILDEYNQFMVDHGQPPERRVLGHSSGYDMVQRPLIRGEDGVVAANTFFALHPGYYHGSHGRSASGWMCDNFLVRQDGPTGWLHDVEQKVFEIDV